MRLIVEQLPIKPGWRDAHVAPWDLVQAIWQKHLQKTNCF